MIIFKVNKCIKNLFRNKNYYIYFNQSCSKNDDFKNCLKSKEALEFNR